VGYTAQGLRFLLAEAGGEQDLPVQTGLIGQYNISNLLGVIGGLRALGVPLTDAALSPTTSPRCRAACSASRGEASPRWWWTTPTPPTLDKGHQALRPMAQARGGQLWCVFGCGGDRDATKRPLMGAIAQRLADRVVVTSDNPRHENPQAIVDQIVAGMKEAGSLKVQIEVDRRLAILQTLAAAGPQDVVLLAGKGHEDYQDVAGVKHPSRTRGGPGRAARQERRVTELTLSLAAQLIPGAQRLGEGDPVLRRVHTDTRTLAAGDCFVALRGERFDAHDFLPQAAAAGAVAVIGSRGVAACGLPGLQVADTLQALQQLATGWRAPQPAADRGDRQQRQDHHHADDRQHPARRRGRAGAGHRGQPEQPHRRAADRAGPAGRAPPAVVELGMNHPARSPSWPPSPSPPWPWSTTPSASTWSSCRRSRPSARERAAC
jgi:hypothetical protein